MPASFDYGSRKIDVRSGRVIGEASAPGISSADAPAPEPPHRSRRLPIGMSEQTAAGSVGAPDHDTGELSSWTATLRSKLDAALGGNPPRPATFVVGNESADADSIICATVVAFLRQVADPAADYLPVIRCREQDLPMRGAAQLLLTQAGINPAHLLYLARDGPAAFSATLARGPTILTDHNVPHDSWLNVTEIIDHHADAGLHEHLPSEFRRILPTISCATLVAEELLQLHTLPASDVSRHRLCKMLLGVILLDSNGLQSDPELTALDTSTANALAKQTNTDIASFHSQLNTALLNESFWMSATPRQALEYDTKVYLDPALGFGVAASSTEIRDFAGFLNSPGLVDSVCDCMVQRDLYLLRMNGVSKDAGVLFAARAGKGRFDMDGLAEDYSRKKLYKKRKMLRRLSVLATMDSGKGCVDAIFYETIPLPNDSALEHAPAVISDSEGHGRGLLNPCWNNGNSCWHPEPQ